MAENNTKRVALKAGPHTKTRTGKGLSIRAKMVSGFVILIIFIAGISALSYSGLGKLNEAEQAQQKSSSEDYAWLQLKSDILNEANAFTMLRFSQDDKPLSTTSVYTAAVKKDIASVRSVTGESRVDILNKIESGYGDWLNTGTVLVTLNAGDNLANADKMNNWNESSKTLLSQVDNGLAESRLATQGYLAASETAHQRMVRLLLGIAAIALAVSVLIAFIIPLTISNGIEKMVRTLQRIAAGDLTENIKVKSSDEVGEMTRACDETQKHLSELVTNLKEKAAKLRLASEELSFTAQHSRVHQAADGADDQSRGVQKAIHAITEVSNALSTVVQNPSQSPQRANQTPQSFQSSAINSGNTPTGTDKADRGRMAKEIAVLGSRSTEIGKIISVIDEIASQTNLLALNAAIGAARSDEQERGLAVMADEIRKLAEHTAKATEEIAYLIDSVQKGINDATLKAARSAEVVSQGYEMAVQAGETLNQMLKTGSAEEMSPQIQEIITSSHILEEMAVSLEQSVATFKVAENNRRLTKTPTVIRIN